jgi:hypothetical protein
MYWTNQRVVDFKELRNMPATEERVRLQKSKKSRPWRLRLGNWTIGHYRTEADAKSVRDHHIIKYSVLRDSFEYMIIERK